jgi:hypothetical protein
LAGSLFYEAFRVTRLYGIGDRVLSERWWIGKDLVGGGHGLILISFLTKAFSFLILVDVWVKGTPSHDQLCHW